MTKYSYNLPTSADAGRLTNQLWKLIPMRENEEDWKTQVESVIVEIAGLGEIFSLKEKAVVLLSKLEGLIQQDTDFYIYRKVVFESITLLREMLKDE